MSDQDSTGKLAPPEPGGPVLHVLRRVLWGVVGLAMFAMMGVTFADVVGRYLLSKPVPGATELVQISMAVLIGAALPLVSAARGHITMALFTDHLRGRVRRALDVLLHIAAAALLAFLAWRMGDQAVSLASSNAGTLFLRIPTAPFAAMLSLMMAITALVELAQAWRQSSAAEAIAT